MYIYISQRDLNWKNKKIGKTKLTIGAYGCLITVLSAMSAWFGNFFSPDWLAAHLTFTSRGLLLWDSINSLDDLPFRFVWRHYSYNYDLILYNLQSPDTACILQVDGKHWVGLVGYSRSRGFIIHDPWDGKRVFLKKRYQKITGWAEITRK